MPSFNTGTADKEEMASEGRGRGSDGTGVDL